MSMSWDAIENGGDGKPTPPKLDLTHNDLLPARVEAVLTPAQSQLANSLLTNGLISSKLLKEAASRQVNKTEATPLSDLVVGAFKESVEPMLNNGNLGKDGYIPKPDDAEVKQLVASGWITQTQVDKARQWQNESLRDGRDLAHDGNVRSFKYALGENLGFLFALSGNK